MQLLFTCLLSFRADCATVALPQIRETEQLSECSHNPTLRPGSTVQPSLARPLDHRMEILKSVPLRQIAATATLRKAFSSAVEVMAVNALPVARLQVAQKR